MERDLYHIVYGYCRDNYKYWEYLYEFDDYLQDSFVKTLSIIDKYDAQRGSLSGYVYKMLHRYWCWYRKSHKFHQDRFERTFLSIDYDEEKDKAGYNLDDRVINEQKSIAEEIEEIEENDLLSNILPYLNNYTYDYYIKGEKLSVIANKYSTSNQNIHAKIQRNLKKIKKLIDNGTISCYN